MLQFHNTLTKKIEAFSSRAPGKVSLYTCGPTVYDFLHVGNWAAYIYWDTLVRTLEAHDYKVERVMNITDVGHLTSDADEGEDKLEKGARREGKTAWEVAEFYTQDFISGMQDLGLISPQHITKATDFIEEQLDLVRTLKDKGYTYQASDGIYFDTSKFPSYADFANLNLESLKAGARVAFSDEKRNPSDFALWKFTPIGEKRDMEWETPADLIDSDEPLMGFPGWHLECSAMAMAILGETIDIHTGGIDHIPVHHTNEIAQSEAATGKLFAHTWLHNNHIKANGTKISKSLNNGYTLSDLKERDFSPLDYRMFVLQSHYRSEADFTFDNLEGAKNRLANWRDIAVLRHQTHITTSGNQADKHDDDSKPSYVTSSRIKEAISNDLGTPEAMRIIDEAFNEILRVPLSRINRHALKDLIFTIDQLLGLQLIESTPDIDDDTKQLILARNRARDSKDWQKSDELRVQIEAAGIALQDTPGGATWSYIA